MTFYVPILKIKHNKITSRSRSQTPEMSFFLAPVRAPATKKSISRLNDASGAIEKDKLLFDPMAIIYQMLS